MAKAFLSATRFQVTINKAALLRQVTAGSNGKVTGREVRKYVVPIIEDAQKTLIKDFFNHSVTKEIKAGPNASNSSRTLGGYGNLFSFIGFDKGSDPTAGIEQILNQKLIVTVRAISSGRFKISITNPPSKDELFSVSQIPWASGSSWADGIEKGISNLGSFLYRSKGVGNSRAGTGIQVLKNLRSTSFQTQPYISKLVDKFYKNIIK
tara:strand:- start:2654 stop:3277 length:624 start_codon:yes stop_codon:yes gene_type:complete